MTRDWRMEMRKGPSKEMTRSVLIVGMTRHLNATAGSTSIRMTRRPSYEHRPLRHDNRGYKCKET